MATTTSPLSSLGDETSFYTAADSRSDKSTTASSPAVDDTCPYRKARSLPHELTAHCQIFLEEQLCKPFSLLHCPRCSP